MIIIIHAKTEEHNNTSLNIAKLKILTSHLCTPLGLCII